jgi:hypothetical protein
VNVPQLNPLVPAKVQFCEDDIELDDNSEFIVYVCAAPVNRILSHVMPLVSRVHPAVISRVEPVVVTV